MKEYSGKDKNNIIIVLAIAAFLRIALVILNEYVPLPDSMDDARLFERLGWDIASSWINNSPQPPVPGSFIYSYLIAGLYFIFGRNIIIPELVNAFLGVLTVYYIYKLTLAISGKNEAAITAGYLAAFFPALNLYSVITMRESIIVFFLLFAVCKLNAWHEKGFAGAAVLSMLSIAAVAVFHSGMVFIAGIILFYLCFFDPSAKSWRLSLKELLFWD